jgi:hypothetical protein
MIATCLSVPVGHGSAHRVGDDEVLELVGTGVDPEVLLAIAREDGIPVAWIPRQGVITPTLPPLRTTPRAGGSSKPVEGRKAFGGFDPRPPPL